MRKERRVRRREEADFGDEDDEEVLLFQMQAFDRLLIGEDLTREDQLLRGRQMALLALDPFLDVKDLPGIYQFRVCALCGSMD